MHRIFIKFGHQKKDTKKRYARLKLDRLGVVFGSEGGAAERRAQDRFNFDEQRRFRRELGGHRRSQRFNGWRAERERGE